MPWVLVALGVPAWASVPASAELRAEVLTALKEATVFILVDAGKGVQSGSGFLVDTSGNRGLVVTNAHVIEPEAADASIRVVLSSGSAEEEVLEAEVLGANREADLALLEVRSPRLPRPIEISTATEVHQTQQVFILGYPFGKALALIQENPGLTIGRGMVAGHRRGEAGAVWLTQIDGDINPGNSGGPIVTSDGALVGVAVSTIARTNIGFAIPKRRVRELLRGILANFEIAQLERGEVSLLADAIDPFGRVESASLLIAPARKVSMSGLVDAEGIWAPIASAKGAPRFEKRPDGRLAVRIAAKHFAEEQTCLAQVVRTDRSGAQAHQAPFWIRLGWSGGSRKEIARATLSGPEVTAAQDGDGQRTGPEILEAPSTIRDVVLAGGGSRLVFVFEDEPQIGVFDVEERRWRGRIAVPGFDFLMTANRDSIFVVTTHSNRLTRYDLQSLKEKRSAEVPTEGRIEAIASGWDSDAAPLLVLAGDEMLLADPRKLRWEAATLAEGSWKLPREGPLLASSDGRRFLRRTRGCGTLSVLHLRGRSLRRQVGRAQVCGYALPAVGAQVFFTGGAGLFNASLEPMGSRKLVGRYLLPDTAGRYFVSVDDGEKGAKLAVHDAKTHRPLLSFDDLDELPSSRQEWRVRRNEPFGPEKRVFLIAEPPTLITIPPSNDRLFVRSLELDGS